MRLLVLPLAALLLLSCQRGDLPKEITRGEHVRYFHDADHAPCPEVTARIDRFVDDVDERFGLELGSGFSFDYFHLERPETGDNRIPEICGGPVAACANQSGVYSAEWAHLHEVLHATLLPSGGAPPVFNEGLAHLVDCGPSRFIENETPRDAPLEDVLSRAQWDAEDGDLSGPLREASASFARFLIDRDGERTYGAFLRDTKHGDDEARVRERFTAHFGESVDASLAAWRASDASLRRGERCIYFEDACDQPAGLSADFGAGSTELPGSCLEEVVVVEATEDATLLVTTATDVEDFRANVLPCDRFEPQRPTVRQFFYEAPITPGTDALFRTHIDPGRWAIKITPEHGRASSPVAVGLGLEPAQQGCEGAPEVKLDADNTALTVAGLSRTLIEDNVWRVRLDTPTLLLRGSLGADSRWRICDDACPLTNCRGLGEDPLPVGDYLLTLEIDGAQATQPVWGAVAVSP